MMQNAHADAVDNKVIDLCTLVIADVFKELPELSLAMLCPVIVYFWHL